MCHSDWWHQVRALHRVGLWAVTRWPRRHSHFSHAASVSTAECVLLQQTFHTAQDCVSCPGPLFWMAVGANGGTLSCRSWWHTHAHILYGAQRGWDCNSRIIQKETLLYKPLLPLSLQGRDYGDGPPAQILLAPEVPCAVTSIIIVYVVGMKCIYYAQQCWSGC